MRSRFMELKKNRLATALNMAVGQGFEPIFNCLNLIENNPIKTTIYSRYEK